MGIMNKKVLGLDLGTNSVGWALVEESENKEDSRIVDCGVRIASLSSDEEGNFRKGKSFSLAQGRTQKRGARRNLDRYQHRRKELYKYLKDSGIIDEHFILAEDGKGTTHELWKLRSESATQKIDLKDFARVLFAINKNRGYKSNRKAQESEDVGEAIDGMEVAKILSEKNITVGQYVLEQLEKVRKDNISRNKERQKKYKVPAFYRSDLQDEFDRIWTEQSKYHTELTNELKEKLQGKNKKSTEDIFKKMFLDNFTSKWESLWKEHRDNQAFTEDKKEKLKKEAKTEEIVKFFGSQNIKISPTYIAEPKNKKEYQFYKWRSEALSQKLALDELAAILVEINNQINASSGYLGAVSDRSKELHFNQQTIGQYLYAQLRKNPHKRLKDQVFYRKDYEKEFDTIWHSQKKFYPNILSDDLKKNIKGITIFYQRRLKSCKHLVGGCEFEKIKYVNKETGKEKEIGIKVCPKSSPLFQEFRIWQSINNLDFSKGKEEIKLSIEEKNKLFKEANLKASLPQKKVFEILGYSEEEYESEFGSLEGNRTNAKIYKAFQDIILEEEGYESDFSKMRADKISEKVLEIFRVLGIDTEFLNFDSSLEGRFCDQKSYQFWHILYSTEEHKDVVKKLQEFGFKEGAAKILSRVVFEQRYGNLSSKALRKILPHMKRGLRYDEACQKAGYRHSNYLTKEENEKRELEKKMELLPRNSLRSPVVEKILNQMINTVNAVIEKHGKPDEVRLEMARDLKKTAKERKKATEGIKKSTENHERIEKKLKEDYKLSRVTRKDVIKYKLWEESKISVYTNKPIKGSDLFNGNYEIEHIIPKALLFDDSFSNKTLCESEFNREKSKKTAYDFIKEKYGKVSDYEKRVEDLFKGKKISKTKKKKLLMTQDKIPKDFIERDLRETQYIAKKAKSLLEKFFRSVHTTTGSITNRLRDDWELTEVMREINFDKYKKYKALDMVYCENSKPDKQGNVRRLKKIKNWTKRDDHRHHAVDALITAFTKHEHVQYLNTLNAVKKFNSKETEASRSDAKYKKLAMLQTFEKEYTFRKITKDL